MGCNHSRVNIKNTRLRTLLNFRNLCKTKFQMSFTKNYTLKIAIHLWFWNNQLKRNFTSQIIERSFIRSFWGRHLWWRVQKKKQWIMLYKLAKYVIMNINNTQNCTKVNQLQTNYSTTKLKGSTQWLKKEPKMFNDYQVNSEKMKITVLEQIHK